MTQILSFWDNCIWIGCLTLSLLRREYLSSAVSVLTNSVKTIHITSRDFFELNCLHSDQSIWKGFCRLDFNSVWARLRRCFSKGPLKRFILSIYLTRFFWVRKIGTTSALRVIFLFENVENLIYIWKLQKKIQKMFFVSVIIASELVALNCLD